MRMKCLRILPETMPRISCAPAPSSLSLNMALGNAVVTVASTSIGSDLATGFLSGVYDSGSIGRWTQVWYRQWRAGTSARVMLYVAWRGIFDEFGHIDRQKRPQAGF